MRYKLLGRVPKGFAREGEWHGGNVFRITYVVRSGKWKEADYRPVRVEGDTVVLRYTGCRDVTKRQMEAERRALAYALGVGPEFSAEAAQP